MFGTPSLSQRNANTNNSFELPNQPADTVACLSWSPVANHLAVASWDKTVRVYEVQVTGMASNSVSVMPRALFTLEAPVLSCCFARDGASVFAGCGDGKVVSCVLATQQTSVLGTHEGAVVSVRHVAELNNMVVTASHDKTVKFFQPGAAAGAASAGAAVTIPHGERVYSMDAKFPLMVVGLADRKVFVYNLQTIMASGNLAPYKTSESKLRLQSRVISCFPDKSGYALASIEGRCSITTIEDPGNKERNFEFKCHRSAEEIFPVHAVDFHPAGVFLTAGGDGQIVIWDKDSKSRVKGFNSVNYPVTAARFSAQGDLLAFAVGYDWAKGHDAGVNVPVKVFVHKLAEADVKVRAANTTPQQSGFSSYGRRR